MLLLTFEPSWMGLCILKLGRSCLNNRRIESRNKMSDMNSEFPHVDWICSSTTCELTIIQYGAHVWKINNIHIKWTHLSEATAKLWGGRWTRNTPLCDSGVTNQRVTRHIELSTPPINVNYSIHPPPTCHKHFCGSVSRSLLLHYWIWKSRTHTKAPLRCLFPLNNQFARRKVGLCRQNLGHLAGTDRGVVALLATWWQLHQWALVEFGWY